MKKKPTKPIRKALPLPPAPPMVEQSPEMLIARAIDRGLPLESLQKLMEMRQQLKAEAAREIYFRSLAAFQAVCPIIVKSRAVYNKADKGGGLRYRYASLDVIVKTVGKLLADHGFSYTITTKQTADEVTAFVAAHHEAGHDEVTSLAVPIDHDAYMTEPQKVASALTYSKRYAFCDAFGILTADEDNDAQEMGSGAPDDDRPRGSPARSSAAATSTFDVEAIYLDIQGELSEKMLPEAHQAKLNETATRLREEKNGVALVALLDSIRRQIRYKKEHPA